MGFFWDGKIIFNFNKNCYSDGKPVVFEENTSLKLITKLLNILFNGRIIESTLCTLWMHGLGL